MATVTARGERVLQEALPIWESTQQHFVDALGPRAWTALSSSARTSNTAYVNVHTTKFPAGEIRGQIREGDHDDQ